MSEKTKYLMTISPAPGHLGIGVHGAYYEQGSHPVEFTAAEAERALKKPGVKLQELANSSARLDDGSLLQVGPDESRLINDYRSLVGDLKKRGVESFPAALYGEMVRGVALLAVKRGESFESVVKDINAQLSAKDTASDSSSRPTETSAKPAPAGEPAKVEAEGAATGEPAKADVKAEGEGESGTGKKAGAKKKDA